MASDSEEELDNFFRHRGPIRKPSPSVPPRSKRRKSSQDDTSSGASADEEGDDASEASSDLEIVGGSTSKQKGKGKAKTKSKEKATTTGRRGRTSLAAPRPLETSSKRAKLVSVDSSSPESSPGHGLRSSTQLLEGGDALEAMARQLGGWKGEGRPPRVGKEAPAAAATSESPETTGKSKRQTSASTAATSSSATKTKSKSAAPRTTKKAPTSTRKKRAPARDDSSPPIELDPAFVEQPPPPDSFWGVKEALPGVSAKKKPVAGEASKRLQEMSKLPPLRARKDDDDEIMGSSQGTSDEQDATGGKYETVTAKAARLRKEALAEQKARREAKQAAAASPKPAPKPKPAAQPSILLSLQKKHCPVCNSAVAPADIEHHTQQCIAAMMEAQTQEQAEIQPPPPPKPKPNPQPPPPPPPPAKITPRQPPPPPKRPVVNRASSHDGYIDSSQLEVIDQEQNLAEELFPPSPSPKRHTAAAKGKGRAVVQEEEDEVEDDYGAYGDENEPYGAEEEDDYGEFEYDDEGEGALWEDPADFAKLHGTTREVIEIGSDDDESVQVATKARMGGGGAVNTGRAKGPPKDGSPPPTGSIYVSTLPHAMRVGYAQMYREKSPKKGESRSSDPLAPQKMTAAAAKPAFRGKGRRGGWGRGRARGGGAKRGARGRK